MPIRLPACIDRVAKYRSIAKTDMPIEPNGTRPISTLCPESFSHIREPMPMPTENTASSNVTTFSSPESTSLAKGENEVRKVAPKYHSQEMPIIDRNTVRL